MISWLLTLRLSPGQISKLLPSLSFGGYLPDGLFWGAELLPWDVPGGQGSAYIAKPTSNSSQPTDEPPALLRYP